MASAHSYSLCTGRNSAPAAVAEYCCHAPVIRSALIEIQIVGERVLAWMLLAAFLPLIGTLMLAIRWSSPGPAIYRQRRVGRGGRIFTMFKLRTMRCDAEARSGPVWAPAGADPRVTWLGAWLRRLHLDELPQLYNVLRGEMALVGPRPERPEFVALLAEQIPGYLDRLRVLPGITGLAQINLPPDTDLYSVRRKLVLDREYISRANLVLDLRIVLCTALRVFGLRGGRAVSLFGLQRVVELTPDPVAQHGDVPRVVPAESSTAVGLATDAAEGHTGCDDARQAFRASPRALARAL